MTVKPGGGGAVYGHVRKKFFLFVFDPFPNLSNLIYTNFDVEDERNVINSIDNPLLTLTLDIEGIGAWGRRKKHLLLGDISLEEGRLQIVAEKYFCLNVI